ncbi:MAG: lipopolysaccharide transport periplasmic protein LptA [Burkholderiales bacterium]|nr:MAG: lipopolysaccharide transport periplasmic protein LptA [Burkholderiales bacterium]
MPGLAGLLGLALAAGLPPAHAAKADRDQPVTVEADRMEYDDQQQTNVFAGRVVMTRGSLVIRGARVVLRQDRAGFYFGTATGTPAIFRQARDAEGETVEGSAERLEYDGRTETVRFVGQASLRRLTKGRVIDEVLGARIVYDSRTEFFTVEGGEGAASAANPSGRVRAVIQPRNGEATARPGPATPLRPSPPGGAAGGTRSN